MSDQGKEVRTISMKCVKSLSIAGACNEVNLKLIDYVADALNKNPGNRVNVTPPLQKVQPRLSPSLMLFFLGGSFPDNGFAWETVHHFRQEDGVWEPYSAFGEILPVEGFRIKAEVEPSVWNTNKP